MMTVNAVSVTPAVAALLRGETQQGRHVGHGYVALSNYVMAVIGPGRPRMPNGIELPLQVGLALGATVAVGDGRLVLPHLVAVPGEEWDARPPVGFVPTLDGDTSWIRPDLAGCGPGLTPLGDDVLIGFLAAHALLGGRPLDWVIPPNRTNGLGTTLLRHAHAGQLPEPAHSLLAHGDPTPLMTFGHTSGRGILVGLAAAISDLGIAPAGRAVCALRTSLSLVPGDRSFDIVVRRLDRETRHQSKLPEPGLVTGA